MVREFMRNSNQKWWRIPATFDCDLFLKETSSIPNQYFFDSNRNIHSDWNQVLLRSFNDDFQGHFWSLGITDPKTLDWKWTEAAIQFCPQIIRWISQIQTWSEVYRVTVSRLGVNGKISPHNDDFPGLQGAFNFCLSSNGAELEIEDDTLIPKPGEIYQLNTVKTHSVKNTTQFDRWHLIVLFHPHDLKAYCHALETNNWQDLLKNSKLL